MGEMRIIKLVFGLFLSAGPIVLLLVAFKLYYKYSVQEERCAAVTAGTVVRYTTATRGGMLPRVPAGCLLHCKR